MMSLLTTLILLPLPCSRLLFSVSDGGRVCADGCLDLEDKGKKNQLKNTP